MADGYRPTAMDHFTAHRLRFVTEAQSTIELNEHQGSAIRGSLFHALRNQFCTYPKVRECADCPLVATCPVATLVSTLRPAGGRGRDVPRPYTIQPPLPGMGGHPVELPDGRVVFRYERGERFEFGLTLYAQALQLFPYIVLAVHRLERGGIGRRTKQADGRWRRGTFVVQEVWAENPLTDERQPVMMADDNLVQVPDIPITHRQVREWAGCQITHHASRITLHFLTPTRIIERGHLLKPERFRFQPLFQRLMERLEALSRDFSDTPLRFDDPRGLVEAAGRVRVADNRLVWEELRSYSTRQRRSTPIGGLLGTVVLEANDWTPFLPWLVWGQFVHVGKDAVKGNGWYRGGWRMEEG
nr:CRISPR system precrRNA processing endoribonuclease RAMP protein Cas6 [Anaerolineae bacterium]